MGLAAGRLDRRITIERYTTTTNEFNEPIKAWTVLATVSASKQDVSDRERQLVAQQVSAEITTRFRIRWFRSAATVDPRDRILFDGRIYGISAVKEIGRREGLEITAAAKAERV